MIIQERNVGATAQCGDISATVVSILLSFLPSFFFSCSSKETLKKIDKRNIIKYIASFWARFLYFFVGGGSVGGSGFFLRSFKFYTTQIAVGCNNNLRALG